MNEMVDKAMNENRRPYGAVSWGQDLMHCTFEELSGVMPEEVIIKAWFEAYLMGELTYAFRPESMGWRREHFVPRFGPLEGIRLSQWQLQARNDHDAFQDARRVLGSIDFSVIDPRLSSTMIFASGTKGGRVEGNDHQQWIADWDIPHWPWLDGHVGHMLHYDGRPVATIGFAALTQGVVLHQVQPLHRKGNRWLYKLPHGLLHAAVQATVTAAEMHGLTAYIVDGEHAGERVRSYYTGEVDENIVNRVKRLYDEDLEGFERGETISGYGTRKELYHRLERAAA